MSALRYPGGKTRAIKILDTYLLSDITELYSPFFGGGSFELFVQNKYNIQIFANDKFEPLFNYWNCVKLDKLKIEQEINKLHPITKDIFNKCKINLKDMTCNTFIRAASYFAINRSSFSGSTTSGGFSEESGNKRFTSSSIVRMKATDLNNVTLSNLDFVDFLKNIPKEKFIFLDPPYYLRKGSKLYGNKGDLHENFDHAKLFSCINKESNFILCYNDCEYIRNLYKDYTIVSASWAYGMNTTKKSSEIFIMPLKFTQKLQEQKKTCDNTYKKPIKKERINKIVVRDFEDSSCDESVGTKQNEDIG